MVSNKDLKGLERRRSRSISRYPLRKTANNVNQDASCPGPVSPEHKFSLHLTPTCLVKNSQNYVTVEE
jgi:hypothetical protein